MDWNKTKVIQRKFLDIKPKLYFTKDILREIFKQRNLSSSKSREKEVQEEYYLDQLLARIQANV
mgnify:CR=1 FL=1